MSAATNTVWTGGTGDWNTATNWNNGIPTYQSGNTATIQNGSTVTTSAPIEGWIVYVNNGSTLTISQAATLTQLRLGNHSLQRTDTLNILDGADITGQLFHICGNNANPTPRIVMTGGRITCTHNGFLPTNQAVVFGYASGTKGYFQMSGGELIVNGTSDTSNGLQDVAFGYRVNSYGEGTITGGSTRIDKVLYIGYQGDGLFKVSGAGTSVNVGSLSIGTESTANGEVTITGGTLTVATSTLNGSVLSDGSVYVGNAGNGTLNIGGTATIRAEKLILTNSDTATSVLNVTDGGAIIQVDELETKNQTNATANLHFNVGTRGVSTIETKNFTLETNTTLSVNTQNGFAFASDTLKLITATGAGTHAATLESGSVLLSTPTLDGNEISVTLNPQLRNRVGSSQGWVDISNIPGDISEIILRTNLTEEEEWAAFGNWLLQETGVESSVESDGLHLLFQEAVMKKNFLWNFSDYAAQDVVLLGLTANGVTLDANSLPEPSGWLLMIWGVWGLLRFLPRKHKGAIHG